MVAPHAQHTAAASSPPTAYCEIGPAAPDHKLSSGAGDGDSYGTHSDSAVPFGRGDRRACTSRENCDIDVHVESGVYRGVGGPSLARHEGPGWPSAVQRPGWLRPFAAIERFRKLF